ADALPMWASVRIIEQRNFFPFAIRRKKQQPMECGAIFSLEVNKLRRYEVEQIDALGSPKGIAASAHAAKSKLGRRHQRGKLVHVILGIGRQRGIVHPGLVLRQNLEVAAIEFHATKMSLSIISSVRRKEDCSGLVIKAFHFLYFEVALGDLVYQLGIRQRISFVE